MSCARPPLRSATARSRHRPDRRWRSCAHRPTADKCPSPNLRGSENPDSALRYCRCSLSGNILPSCPSTVLPTLLSYVSFPCFSYRLFSLLHSFLFFSSPFPSFSFFIFFFFFFFF